MLLKRLTFACLIACSECTWRNVSCYVQYTHMCTPHCHSITHSGSPHNALHSAISA